MARFRKKKDGFGAKIRFGEGRDEWFTLPFPHEEEAVALDRFKRLQRMAKLLQSARRHAEARVILEEAAAELGEKAFRAVELMVEGLAPPEEPAARKPLTFREVAQLWTSGKLHELYPDRVTFKEPAGRDADQGALAVFFPAIGDKAIAELTDQDIDAATARIPKGSAPRTRAAYCKRLRFVLRLAVRVLKAAPSHPEVAIPRARNATEFTFLYPAEEALLARCSAVPFAYRFLYAFLARNGTRISETLMLTWDHVNLTTGTIHLDKAWTKTRRARFFTVEPDVLAALRVRREEQPEALVVFTGQSGKPITRGAARVAFRGHLRKAKVDRPEALGELPDVRALTIHDLRASFVTLARLRGMKDRWIRDHSGHESPSQLDKYDRFVRHAEELHLGWYSPMWRVLGMVEDEESLARVLGQSWAKGAFIPVNEALESFHSEPGEQSRPHETSANVGTPALPTPPDPGPGPAEKPHLDQERVSLAQPPPSAEDAAALVLARIEESLAGDLKVAIAAGRFELAERLLAELGERRRSRTAPAVPSLADARAKRDKGEGK